MSDVSAEVFYGSGAGLNSLPAAALVGTLDDTRLSGNVALKNALNVFTVYNTFAQGASFTANVGATAIIVAGRASDGLGTILWYDNIGVLCGYIRNYGPDLHVVGTGQTWLESGGDIVLAPTGRDVLPYVNYAVNLGLINYKFLSVYAAELWVETLVAQNTIATIGGRLLVAPTNILTVDINTTQTTITVKYNNMANGARIYMESNGQLEFMAVATTAPTGGPGAWVYPVIRNLNGGPGRAWFAGDAILITGLPGDGFIDLYSQSGVLGTGSGPAIVGNVRLGYTYSDYAPRWAIGNLNGLYGYGTTMYGSAFGDPLGTNVTVDATNGFRVRFGVVNKLVADTSGNLSLVGDLSVGLSGSFRTAAAVAPTVGTGVYIGGGASPTFRVGNPAGDMIDFNVSTANATTISGNIIIKFGSYLKQTYGTTAPWNVPTGVIGGTLYLNPLRGGVSPAATVVISPDAAPILMNGPVIISSSIDVVGTLWDSGTFMMVTSYLTAPPNHGGGIVLGMRTLDFYDSTQPTDGKFWRVILSGGQLHFQTVNDAYTSSLTAIRLDRDGNILAGRVYGFNADTDTYMFNDIADSVVMIVGGNNLTYWRPTFFFPGVDNHIACGAPSFRWTAVYAVNGTIQTSDAEAKTHIRDDASLGLAFVRQLRVRAFEYIDDPTARLGFVTQEVETALDGRQFAALVKLDGQFSGLNYAGFVPVLTTAVQELDRRVTQLERHA